MRKQRILLKNGVDIALVGRNSRNVHALKENTATCWLLKTRNHFQCCGFAAARWPQHGEELAATNREVGVFYSGERTILLAHVIEVNDFRC